ncbi:hypothetical protein DES53_101129 [Roseimicrobium gellanilyticum]|uniref:NAD glycohydrolase translocation F5/8 type C domain-containing protein n=1 Tax=Roseimicrobium gellanilyticum TaxID=748857 RepID=A0A366HSU2_9BACT|nr:hypothetical protein [Roseimicrobium gellanilyticum]RBP47332.1 hypothetical protein DES53_101129 [Roseimicrobium gellanilyticum]
MRVLPIALLVSLLTFAGSSPLFANGGGYTKGLASTGAFKPFGIEQVEMLSERLEIDLHIEYAEVRIEYVLHNPGPKVKAEAGFPSAVERKSGLMGLPERVDEKHRIEDLAMTVDGEPVSLRVEPDDLYLKSSKPLSFAAEIPAMTIKAWHVFAIDFGKGQTRKVTVRYRHPYADSLTYVSSNARSNGPSLAYIFSSAAAWQGPIRQGTVMVRAKSVDPERVQLSHPKRFQREGNTWTWLFTDFEPTLEDDMVISPRPGKYSPENVIHQLKDGEVNEERISYVQWYLGESEDRGWELHRSDYAATASSTLPPDGSRKYGVENVADWSKETAWVEGVPGQGIGESITLTLPTPAKVRRAGIVNGLADSGELYFANSRVAKLDVSVNGGKPVRVELPDEMLSSERFYFDLPDTKGEAVKSVKLTIAEVYPGTKFEDTCISDVVLVVPLSKKPKLHPIR